MLSQQIKKKKKILCIMWIWSVKSQCSAIPAVTKSAVFTGMLARLARARFPHSKQWFRVMLFILYLFLVVSILIPCTDSELLAGATGLSRLSRTKMSFLYSLEILSLFKAATVFSFSKTPWFYSCTHVHIYRALCILFWLVGWFFKCDHVLLSSNKSEWQWNIKSLLLLPQRRR